MKGAAGTTASGVRTLERERGRLRARGLVSLRGGGTVKGSDCEGGTEKRRIALMEWAWIALLILGDGEERERVFGFLGRRRCVC